MREETDRRHLPAPTDRLCIRADVERLIHDTKQTKEAAALGQLSRSNALQQRERALLSERRWRASSAAPSDQFCDSAMHHARRDAIGPDVAEAARCSSCDELISETRKLETKKAGMPRLIRRYLRLARKNRARRKSLRKPVLDGFLEFFRRAERDFLAGFNLDRFASRRITAHARRTLANLQHTETADADLVTLLEVLGEQADEVAQDLTRNFLREFMLVGERRRQMLQRDDRRLIG